MSPKVHRRFLIRVICRLYEICGLAVKCHASPQDIARMFPRHLRGLVYEALEQLVREGILYEKHHGKGRRSYGFTTQGIETARLILKKCLEK